jgi:hypothetical protein
VEAGCVVEGRGRERAGLTREVYDGSRGEKVLGIYLDWAWRHDMHSDGNIDLLWFTLNLYQYFPSPLFVSRLRSWVSSSKTPRCA